MDVVETLPNQQRKVAERLAKPLQTCFESEREAEREWYEEDVEGLFAIGMIKPGVQTRPSDKVIEEYGLEVRRVRRAQARSDHSRAIRLTTRALRLIREQPRHRRGPLKRQAQELLNLRSVSLIAVGECGEAWRCITLMSKLW